MTLTEVKRFQSNQGLAMTSIAQHPQRNTLRMKLRQNLLLKDMRATGPGLKVEATGGRSLEKVAERALVKSK